MSLCNRRFMPEIINIIVSQVWKNNTEQIINHLDTFHTFVSLFLLESIDVILLSKNFSLTNHFPALEGDITRDRKHPFQDMFLESCNSLSFERHLCCNHEVQEHTKSPDIYRRPQVALIPKQLRCCIWR